MNGDKLKTCEQFMNLVRKLDLWHFIDNNDLCVSRKLY